MKYRIKNQKTLIDGRIYNFKKKSPEVEIWFASIMHSQPRGQMKQCAAMILHHNSKLTGFKQLSHFHKVFQISTLFVLGDNYVLVDASSFRGPHTANVVTITLANCCLENTTYQDEQWKQFKICNWTYYEMASKTRRKAPYGWFIYLARKAKKCSSLSDTNNGNITKVLQEFEKRCSLVTHVIYK